MLTRTQSTLVLKDENGTRYKGIPKDIVIPKKESDIYITWRKSYNVTLLSNKYYDTPGYYWIILEANDVVLQTDFLDGQKIRIPTKIGDILEQI